MSTNAATWFYSTPEANVFLITERLNGTFWQARIAGLYWRCTHPQSPFAAEGYWADEVLELKWVPNQWLTLRVPQSLDVDLLVDAVSRRILGITPVLTYGDLLGNIVYEWHVDGGQQRWREIQGMPEFVRPRRLGKRGR
ncbi:MAG: hypothetical protein GYB68_17215 [Chloroflexi bacterium]|nr:hypothetical protein [Chloroflexota bacterium]